MPATKQHCREYRRRLKSRVAEIYGDCCQTCQRPRSATPLQLAHIKPTGLKGKGRGLTRRMLDAIRNRECYVLECVECHYLRDQRRLFHTTGYPPEWDSCTEDF